MYFCGYKVYIKAGSKMPAFFGFYQALFIMPG